MIPREDYPLGAGYNRSAFIVQRSNPSSDEENWPAIQAPTSAGGELTANACQVTYNKAYVGYLERVYGPSGFGLRGPLICQDELAMHWQSVQFWEMYFQALEKRVVSSIGNRLMNEYLNFAPVIPSTTGFLNDMTDPLHYTSQVLNVEVPPAQVDLSDLPKPTESTYCDLTQEMLDILATYLMEEGATDPNSNGWLSFGPSGPVFPLLIGQEASQRILLNNADLRADIRTAWDAFADAAPLLKRRGASLVIKNWRHVITLTPPRWHMNANGTFTRVPVYKDSTAAADVTKGHSPEINPSWRDPGYADFEGAIPLTPWVFHEEILRPINAVPGQKWQAQNYMGEWNFVTGNDALINTSDSCAGITDPMHKQGRHFAEYRHAAKPIFPKYGSWILFKRCPNTPECVTCS